MKNIEDKSRGNIYGLINSKFVIRLDKIHFIY